MFISLADTVGLTLLTSGGIILLAAVGWSTGGNAKTVLGALDM